MLVCDTGPLVAAALTSDPDHHACVELFTGVHLAGRELLVPAPGDFSVVRPRYVKAFALLP